MSRLALADVVAATLEALPEWGAENVSASAITKGGSDRQYFRIHFGDEKSVVFMAYTDARPDNLAFVSATKILSSRGVAVPKIYAEDEAKRYLWLEDLGRDDLWELRDGPWEPRLPLYEKTLEEVAKLHAIDLTDLSEAETATLQPAFDSDYYLWEQDYFFDNFALLFSSASGEEIAAIRKGEALRNLRDELAALPRSLVHRDFQSQNVIVRDGAVYFIDYQGLRPGRPEYDVASMIYDPYVAIDQAARDALLAHYCDCRRRTDGWSADEKTLAGCAAQRLMQALGAYGNLGENLGKTEFLQHIDPALENLRHVLERYEILPELLPVLRR